MNRSLARSLTPLSLIAVSFLLIVLFPATSSAISQKSLSSIMSIAGSTAYSYPNDEYMRVQNLRTGAVHSVSVPRAGGISSGPARANSRAAVFGNRIGVLTPAELWFVRSGVTPRLLASVPQTGASWCDMFNSVTPLQLDKSNVTLAVTLRYGPVGNGCVPIVDQSTLDEYESDGSRRSVALPYKYRAILGNAVAARGTRVLFRTYLAKTMRLAVYDFANQRTIWEGERPSAGLALKLLDGNRIGSSFNSETVNHGWAERFNYKSGKALHISFGSGLTEFCGRFVVQSTFSRIQIFNERGRQIYSRASGRNSSFNQPICSERFLRISRWTSVKATEGFWNYRLIDLRNLK